MYKIVRTFKQLFEKKPINSTFQINSNVIWKSSGGKHNEQLEKVQSRASEILPNLKQLANEKRMRKLKLPRCKYSRIQGHMNVLKIITRQTRFKSILKTKQDPVVKTLLKG